MKLILKIILIGSFFLGACSSMKTSYVYDDLYNSPNDEVVVSNKDINETANADLGSEQSIEQKINSILKDTSVQEIDSVVYENENVNPYDKVLVDDYASAYDKRVNAFQDPYYGMNNINVLFSDDYWYASAYDPYYYNMIVVGSQVWVEPRYISSSFGFSFGSRFNSFSYGYNSPFYNYGYPYSSFGYNNYYGYNPYSYYGYYPGSYWNGYYNNYYYYGSSVWTNSLAEVNKRRGIAGSSRYNNLSRGIPEVHTNIAGRESSNVKSGLDNNGTDRRAVRRTDNTNTTDTKNIRRSNLSNTQITENGASRRRITNYTRPANSTSTYNTARRTSTSNYNNVSKNVSTNNTRYTRPRRSVSTTKGSSNNNNNNRSTYNRRSSSSSNYSRSNNSSTRRSSSVNSSSRSSSSSSSSSSRSSSSNNSSSSSSRRSGRR
ncbi:MAG: hypothetical protein U9R54_02680 [Bacteroidota bacterium]|nr:hypothetical protein [Bacteroidota bacterium]